MHVLKSLFDLITLWYGYSKESYQWEDSFEYPHHRVCLDDKRDFVGKRAVYASLSGPLSIVLFFSNAQIFPKVVGNTKWVTRSHKWFMDCYFYPFPHTTNLQQTTLKTEWQKPEKNLLKWNIVAILEIAHHLQFSPLVTMFS